MALRQTFAIVSSRLGTLIGVTLWLYVPYFLAYGAMVASGVLPEKGVEAVLGFLSLIVAPIGNAAIIHIVHNATSGLNVSMWEGIKVGIRVWSRLVAAYIAISFVWLGYLVVTVLPGAAVMYLCHVTSPLLLIPFALVGTLLALPPYAFVDALVVLEGLLPWQARQASWQMTKGKRRQIIALGLLLMALPLGLELLNDHFREAILPYFFGEPFVAIVFLGVASSLFYILPVVLSYVLYSDALVLRVKNTNMSDASFQQSAAQPAKILDFKRRDLRSAQVETQQ